MKSSDVVKSGSLSRLIPPTILILAAVVISGCATADIDHPKAPSPPKRTPFKLERMPSESVLVSEVHAVRDGDGMLIYGKVKRAADNCCDAARGHVNITVVGPDGEVVDVVSVRYSPRNIPKTRSRSSRFIARLPYVVPSNFPLRISYHSDDENTFSGTDPTDSLVWKKAQAKSDSKS